jgi:holo-[acyl-carrier protein] synthase
MVPEWPFDSSVSDVVGVGVDVVDVADFERMPLEDKRGFYERCFTQAEISYCRSKPEPAKHFAARFAAKEAAVKAAADLCALVPWDFEIELKDSGKPSLRLRGDASTGSRSLMAGHRAHVSLTHGDAVAGAVVVLCKERSSE